MARAQEGGGRISTDLHPETGARSKMLNRNALARGMRPILPPSIAAATAIGEAGEWASSSPGRFSRARCNCGGCDSVRRNGTSPLCTSSNSRHPLPTSPPRRPSGQRRAEPHSSPRASPRGLRFELNQRRTYRRHGGPVAGGLPRAGRRGGGPAPTPWADGPEAALGVAGSRVTPRREATLRGLPAVCGQDHGAAKVAASASVNGMPSPAATARRQSSAASASPTAKA
jgi:hypothetical protein